MKKMTLDEACKHWNLKQSEVDFVTSEFEGRKWWRNNRTFEMIEVADEPRPGRGPNND